MRPLGQRPTKSLAGHQNCGVCHPRPHPSDRGPKMTERQRARAEIARALFIEVPAEPNFIDPDHGF